MNYKINKPIRLLEFFGGIGSQSTALERLGADFTSYKLIEIDKYCVRTYNILHKTNFSVCDIKNIHSEDLEILDQDEYTYIFTYSFPCQDISNAGSNEGFSKGSNTRSSLLWELERILVELSNNLPPVLIMENVPAILSKRNIGNFERWKEFLSEMGYRNFVSVLNSKDFGIPQNRDRCFMVSIKGDFEYIFPEKKTLTASLNDFLEENVSEKYFLSDSMKRYISAKPSKNYLIPKPIINPKIARTICANYGRYRAGINTYISPDKPDNYDLSKCENIEEVRIRKLTPCECWKLMGFTELEFDQIQNYNSDTQLYKQAGNAIVIPVLENIFKMLIGGKQ